MDRNWSCQHEKMHSADERSLASAPGRTRAWQIAREEVHNQSCWRSTKSPIRCDRPGSFYVVRLTSRGGEFCPVVEFNEDARVNATTQGRRSQNFERTRPGGRRERSVEVMEVVAGQLDVAGGGVLPNVGRCSGAWDGVDAVVLKHPG